MHPKSSMPKEAAPEIPAGLQQAVQNKRVVMFLGAGASKEAIGSNGAKPPTSEQLRAALGKEFFGNPLDGYNLMSVADMAIKTAGQGVVFEKVRAILAPFKPGLAHGLLPRFQWRAIATTNYDTLIEGAYATAAQPMQNVVPFVKNAEPVEERLQNTQRPLLLLKLHGCLTHLHDEAVPLILSNEHYAFHAKNRDRLFNRLSDMAHESTFVFCGYSLGDAHIRDILYRLGAEGVKRPTWYIVTPTMIDAEAIFWGSSNVQVIKATFGAFMQALHSVVPEMWRGLDPGVGINRMPIQDHFRTLADPSTHLTASLEKDVKHIHSAMPVDGQDAKKFYSGYDNGWGAITQELDVQRRVVDDLLFEVVLDDTDSSLIRLHLLRGPAGSGKTVALKRAAWNAATQLGQLVLWLEDTGALRIEVFAELYALTGKRVLIFVDRAAERWKQLQEFLAGARTRSLPVSVVAAERDNEWNVYGAKPADAKSIAEIRIDQLSTKEMNALVDLLERHNSLGLLQDKPRDEQVRAFLEHADRQLLVALHEVTRGKPFEEIVHDEYANIVPERARRLYLDICTLNQFGVSVRAGTISRVSGIRFEEFEEKLFAPLESVVMVTKDRYSGDMGYRARHARVAEMVFRQACQDDDARVEQIKRMIEHLDIGYSSDRTALEQVSRGRSLKDMIGNVALGREVYQAMHRIIPGEAFVHQQAAIYEMLVSGGSYDEAERLAGIAAGLNPRSRSVAHTYAEVARRRAQMETSPLRRQTLRKQARQRLNNAGTSSDELVIGTRCKILVDEVADLVAAMRSDAEDASVQDLAEKVRDAEALLRQAHQLHPESADLLQSEARFREILDQNARAVSALERAWRAKPPGSAVAVRLSKAYAARGDHLLAREILTDALGRYADDKNVHFEFARLLLASDESVSPAIGYHLERSYARRDRNFDARHLHAQYLFMIGQHGLARDLFDEISHSAPEDFRSRVSLQETPVSVRLGRYDGRVVRREASYAFISAPCYAGHIYAPARHNAEDQWQLLRPGTEVQFSVSFTRRGPFAFGLSLSNGCA